MGGGVLTLISLLDFALELGEKGNSVGPSSPSSALLHLNNRVEICETGNYHSTIYITNIIWIEVSPSRNTFIQSRRNYSNIAG